MKKQNIPIKNYIILGILVVVTIFLTFYLSSWYKTSKEYKSQHSVVADLLSTIKIEDIDNYLIDNPNIVIYMASSKDNQIVDFENDFKNFVLKEEINDELVYLDTSTITSDNDYQRVERFFSDKLQKDNIKLVNKTNLLVVKDGKIFDIMYTSEKREINIEDVEQFLKIYEVIE